MRDLKIFAKKTILRFALSNSIVAPEYFKMIAMNMMRIEYRPSRETLDKAIFCLSVDFDVTNPNRAKANNEGTTVLLDLAEKYDIPITWAICGKTAEEYPEQFERILRSTTKREIAVHTYSHIDVSRCTTEELLEDFERFRQTLGISDFETFVFPWNRIGHLDTLRNLGFTSYRGKERRIGIPIRQNGLWNVAPVLYAGNEIYRHSFLAYMLLELCVKTHSIFHLWTHPWDVVKPTPEDYIKRTLIPLFSKIDEYRKAGVLQTMTMGEIAKLMTNCKHQ